MGSLLRNVNLINILLAAAIILSAHFYVLPLVSREVKFTAPPVRETQPAANAPKPVTEPAAPPIDFNLIADQNLFHPERKIPVEKAAEEKSLPKPDLVLYGTLITDDQSLAYVEDKLAPFSTPGRGKRLRVLKKGDTVGGFLLKAVEPDRIVLVRGDETMTVTLEESKAKKTESTETKGAPAAGPTPIAPRGRGSMK